MKTNNSPPGCRRNWLKVHPPTLNKVRKDTGPILPRIPSDLRRRVNLDWHDLGDTAALDDDDKSTDAPAMSASFLAPLDVGNDEWVTDVRPRYDVGRGY